MAQRGGLLEPARPYQLPSGQYWAIVPVLRQAPIYDLRSTFAPNALAAGVSVFELAMIMGTSGAMIERHYGRLIEGAGADIARRLGDFEATRDRSGDVVASDEGRSAP